MPLLVVPIFLPSRRALRRQLDHAVVGQDHLRAVGDEETPIDVDAHLANAADLVEKVDGIEHHAVADDALAPRPKHAAGNELQDELVLANDDGVPGVMPAGVARHGGKPLAQHVYNLSLALVAPLGAQHHSRLRSHRRPDSTRSPAAAGFQVAVAHGHRFGCGPLRPQPLRF